MTTNPPQNVCELRGNVYRIGFGMGGWAEIRGAKTVLVVYYSHFARCFSVNAFFPWSLFSGGFFFVWDAKRYHLSTFVVTTEQAIASTNDSHGGVFS